MRRAPDPRIRSETAGRVPCYARSYSAPLDKAPIVTPDWDGLENLRERIRGIGRPVAAGFRGPHEACAQRHEDGPVWFW